MNYLTAVGIAIIAGAVATLGYITYKHYKEISESAQQQGSGTETQQNIQYYSVYVYNACNYSVTVNYVDIYGNQQSVTLTPGMGVKVPVQPNSMLSITDNNGNQLLPPTPIQGNVEITTCPSGLFQEIDIKTLPPVTKTITKTKTISGCVGCSNNQTTSSNNNQTQSATTSSNNNQTTSTSQSLIIFLFPPILS